MKRGKATLKVWWYVLCVFVGSSAGIWLSSQTPPTEPPASERCGDNDMVADGYWQCFNDSGTELCRVQRPVCRRPIGEIDRRYAGECWVTCCDYGGIHCCRFNTYWRKCKKEDGSTCLACLPWGRTLHLASSCSSYTGECVTAGGSG